MRDETMDWLICEMREAQEENIALKQELETLKSRIATIILEPEQHDAEGNHLTGSQIRDRQIKNIATLVFPPKIRPMMGLFTEIDDDLGQLKIGFKS